MSSGKFAKSDPKSLRRCGCRRPPGQALTPASQPQPVDRRRLKTRRRTGDAGPSKPFSPLIELSLALSLTNEAATYGGQAPRQTVSAAKEGVVGLSRPSRDVRGAAC